MIHSRPFLRKQGPPGWPVWILFVAWLGANAPQELTLHFAVWAGHARHFAHQAQLKAEVAWVLGGKKSLPVASVAQSPSARPATPPVPVELVLKKIDLYVALLAEPLPPGILGLDFPDRSARPPDPVRAEPPLPPPRALRIA